MILSSLMINCSSGVHPGILVLNSLSSISSRVYCLNERVCLTPEVLWQVSVIRGATVLDLFQTSGPNPINDDVGICDTTLSDSGGDVAYIINFFESYSMSAMVTRVIESINFFTVYRDQMNHPCSLIGWISISC